MIAKQSQLYLTLFLLFLAHGVEESITRFFDSDQVIELLSRTLSVSPEVVFYSVQIVWLGLLFGIYRTSIRKVIPSWFKTLIGLVFVVETSHIVPAIINLNYYPGLFTSIAIVIFGFYYWSVLRQKSSFRKISF